ncbi:uncharacterized protein LOC106994247 [Macaca mulatta]
MGKLREDDGEEKDGEFLWDRRPATVWRVQPVHDGLGKNPRKERAGNYQDCATTRKLENTPGSHPLIVKELIATHHLVFLPGRHRP